MKKKIYVLDTNVLIHNPQAMFNFQDNELVIPITVIEEIDNFKKGLDEKGRNARQIGRNLDKLRKKGSLKDGIKLDSGGILRIAISKKLTSAIDILIKDTNDNLIIGTAYHLSIDNKDSEVILISKDANVRIKADAIGIKAENYEEDNINFQELYSGLSEISVSKGSFEKFKSDEFLENNFGKIYPNQFVRIKLEGSEDISEVARYSFENNTIYPLRYYKGKEIFGISSRNEEQLIAMDLLLDPNVKLVSLVGKAGTGKTLLALAAGLDQVIEKNSYNRLVVSRPIFPLGKDMGYLPGSKKDKFNPWMQPIYDNMEILLASRNGHKEGGAGKKDGKRNSTLQDFLDYGFIQLEPLTYIRGRSLANQFIIIDEAQNLTPHEMKTIITRAGEGTKIILTGDPYQIDIPYLDSESNGLSIAVEKFKQEAIVGHVTLTHGERSELADLAAKFF